jgi:hypothetical protein
MTLLEQAGAAAEVAREAFAVGDLEAGMKAIQFAAQLVVLHRMFDQRPCDPRTCEHECLGLGYCVRSTRP